MIQSDFTGKFVIKGITKDGHHFRPSDWAQRLTSAVGTPAPGRRIKFHPKVKMATIEGVNCVVLDKNLENEEPMLFSFLMDFANENQLQIEGH